MSALSKLLQDKFTSGNSIEVDKVTVSRDEYLAAIESKPDSGYSDDRNSLANEIRGTLKSRGYWCSEDNGPDVINAVALALESKPDSEWISVKDRFPEGEATVLAVVEGFELPIVVDRVLESCNPYIEAYFDDYYYWDMYGNDGALDPSSSSVTHWMPLPAPPQSKDID